MTTSTHPVLHYNVGVPQYKGMDAIAITVEAIEAPNFNAPVLTEIHGSAQFPPDKSTSTKASCSRTILRPRNAQPERPLSVNEIMIQQQLARHKLVLELAGTEAGQAAIASAVTQESPIPVALCAAPVGVTPSSSTQPVEADDRECPDFL